MKTIQENRFKNTRQGQESNVDALESIGRRTDLVPDMCAQHHRTIVNRRIHSDQNKDRLVVHLRPDQGIHIKFIWLTKYHKDSWQCQHHSMNRYTFVIDSDKRYVNEVSKSNCHLFQTGVHNVLQIDTCCYITFIILLLKHGSSS